MSENEIKKHSEETSSEDTEVLNTRAVFDHDDDDDDETSGKNSAKVRIALHAVVIVILFLGIIDVVSKTITIPVGSALLLFTACWNATVYYKEGRKKQAIFTFIICAILAVMIAMYFLLQSDLIK